MGTGQAGAEGETALVGMMRLAGERIARGAQVQVARPKPTQPATAAIPGRRPARGAPPGRLPPLLKVQVRRVSTETAAR